MSSTTRCWELEEAISMYADDELPQGQRLALEAHLAECPHCQGRLVRMRAIAERIRTLGRRSLALDVADEVIRRVGG
jgi:anti-sigma factor RsiW